MRLTPDQIQAIKQTAHAVLGSESRVILFGSRVDDAKRGGDIDLLFETDHLIGNRATTVGALYVSLIRKLGDRKIDIISKRPSHSSGSSAGNCTTNRHPVMSLKYHSFTNICMMPKHSWKVCSLHSKHAKCFLTSSKTLKPKPIA